MNSTQLTLATGATFRQIDHWSRVGYLRPVGGEGSGHVRDWPDNEVRVATLMTRLVKAGVAPKAAHRAARHDGELAPGVRVSVDTAVTV